MNRSGEIFVFFLVTIVVAYWGYRMFQRWLHSAPRLRLPLTLKDQEAFPPDEHLSDILLEAGYELLTGKQRVPIRIDVDGEAMRSRYFIDGVARDEESWYVVKVSRARQNLEWTGSSLRDKLLPYALLFDEAAGILYVDLDDLSVRKIRFEMSEVDHA